MRADDEAAANKGASGSIWVELGQVGLSWVKLGRVGLSWVKLGWQADRKRESSLPGCILHAMCTVHTMCTAFILHTAYYVHSAYCIVEFVVGLRSFVKSR